MLRTSIIILAVMVSAAWAAGLSPGGNVDMGCTMAGQTLTYNGSSFSCQAPTRPTTTVGALAGLCNAGTQGMMYFVTDALLPVALATVGSGGAVKVGVTCNGVNWIVQ
jgi:hypothetical protein